MNFTILLNSLSARAAVIASALIAAAAGIFLAVSGFITGTLADERYKPSQEILQAAIGYFPNASRLHAQVAEAELAKSERDLQLAEFHARRAASLSPYDYRHRMLLAAAVEARGDRTAAEHALREAARLAPNYPDPHWRLANLLLRQGKLGKSLEEFRGAAALRPALLPATFDLIWNAAGGHFAAMDAATPDMPEARVALARFLLNRSRLADAVNVFSRLDRESKLASSETPAFLNALVSGGHYETARKFWADIVGGATQAAIVWNGSFESNVRKDFAQFDWTVARSDYARIGVVATAARSGSRSLKIEFAGRDTTRLNGEVKQLVALNPGASYRLECYVKTENLDTPEGPRLAVLNAASGAEVATSAPIAAGTSDWQLLQVDFVAPADRTPDSSAVIITVQRQPKFSYDEPTKGAVWLDDFTINRR
ncbi:MAG TPA: hypothetical protein VNO70_26715 [Blastocatellia bacterium]|nr:hypothetical protein [Blastocatellia bacterium]